MSADMKTDIRAFAEFFVSTVDPIEIDEILEHRSSTGPVQIVGPVVSPVEPRQRRWRPIAVAVAVLVVLVGGMALAFQVTEPETPVITQPDPVPTTVPETSPTTVSTPPSVVDSLGYRWSRVPHDDAVFGGAGRQGMNDVAVGGPGLVAVGFDGGPNDVGVWNGPDTAAVWTSVDGVTWSRVPHDEAVFGGDGDGKRWMDTVIAGGPGLVAIGEIDATNWDDGAAAVWTSVDGLTWTLHEDAFNGAPLSDVAVGGPGMVGVGANEQGAVVWTSADGVTWSRVPHDQEVFGIELGGGNGMTGITVGGPGFVAVGSDGVVSDGPTGRGRAVVWTSVDGLTWSRVPHDEAVFGGLGDQGMFDVTVGGPGLVAVGENAQGAPIWTSADGLTWTQVPNDDDVFGGPNKAGTPGGTPGSFVVGARINHVAAGGLGLVAYGENEQGHMVWTSVDGITWTRDEGIVAGVGHVDPQESRLIAAGPGLVLVGTDRRDAVVWVATPEN